MGQNLTEEEKRKLFKAFCRRFNAVAFEREILLENGKADSLAKPNKRIPHPVLPDYPSIPPEAIGLKCGAKTRAGTPCKRKDLFDNGRCRLHGGLSTGPLTAKGKKRSALNGFCPKKKQTP